MIRRMQLLGPEDRPSAPRLATLGERIRGALLHDNKVAPAVFAALALLIFVWLGVGALMGGDSGEEQTSSQASLNQQEPKGGREPEGG